MTPPRCINWMQPQMQGLLQTGAGHQSLTMTWKKRDLCGVGVTRWGVSPWVTGKPLLLSINSHMPIWQCEGKRQQLWQRRLQWPPSSWVSRQPLTLCRSSNFLCWPSPDSQKCWAGWSYAVLEQRPLLKSSARPPPLYIHPLLYPTTHPSIAESRPVHCLQQLVPHFQLAELDRLSRTDRTFPAERENKHSLSCSLTCIEVACLWRSWKNFERQGPKRTWSVNRSSEGLLHRVPANSAWKHSLKRWETSSVWFMSANGFILLPCLLLPISTFDLVVNSQLVR